MKHTEESENIWFEVIEFVSIEELKTIAKNQFNRSFDFCETESELWNEIDFRDYFDEFCEVLKRRYLD